MQRNALKLIIIYNAGLTPCCCGREKLRAGFANDLGAPQSSGSLQFKLNIVHESSDTCDDKINIVHAPHDELREK
jgi:hypothetical protein